MEHSRLEENHLQIIWETTDKPFSSMCNCEGLLIFRQNRSVCVVMNSEVLNKFRTSVALMLAVVDVLKYSTWLRKAFENQRDS